MVGFYSTLKKKIYQSPTQLCGARHREKAPQTTGPTRLPQASLNVAIGHFCGLYSLTGLVAAPRPSKSQTNSCSFSKAPSTEGEAAPSEGEACSVSKSTFEHHNTGNLITTSTITHFWTCKQPREGILLTGRGLFLSSSSKTTL